MARKRSRLPTVNTKAPRDINILSPQNFVRLLSAPVPTVSDRRVFDFERASRRAYVSVGPRSASGLVARPAATHRALAGHVGVPTAIAFRDPARVDLCSRREERKRVMHARGSAGGKVRRPRRNAWSGVSC